MFGITPGMLSSEFRLNVVLAVLGVILIGIGAFKGQHDLIEKGTWLLLGGAGAYSVSRGIAKMGKDASAEVPTDEKSAAEAVAKTP